MYHLWLIFILLMVGCAGSNESVPTIPTQVVTDQKMSAENMNAIVVAMHNYHVRFNRLPGHAMYDKARTKPLLSWRVKILPYMKVEKMPSSTTDSNSMSLGIAPITRL